METEGGGKYGSVIKKAKSQPPHQSVDGAHVTSSETQIESRASELAGRSYHDIDRETNSVKGSRANAASNTGILAETEGKMCRQLSQPATTFSHDITHTRMTSAPTEGYKTAKVIGEMETPARQVIAVSASKGPSAFFNLARKFLVTDEMCDLSALEGAIVSAVDAAHLLERSKLAHIVR